MSIGQRIKEERERLKLSQPAFGDIGEMGKTTVISWERGTAFPNAAFLEKAAKFGMDVYYVITGERLANTAVTPMEVALLDNYRNSAAEVRIGVSKLLAETGRALERANAMTETKTRAVYIPASNGLAHGANSNSIHDADCNSTDYGDKP